MKGIKLSFEGDTKKVKVIPKTFLDLTKLVEACLGGAQHQTIKYMDEEGDFISICSELEWIEALEIT